MEICNGLYGGDLFCFARNYYFVLCSNGFGVVG